MRARYSSRAVVMVGLVDKMGGGRIRDIDVSFYSYR